MFASALTVLAAYVPVALPVILPVWMVLSFFSMLPLLLLALLYGFDATLKASVTALILAFVGRYVFQMDFNVWGVLPQVVACVVIARFVLLSRGDSGTLEWYPAGRILLMVTGVLVLATAATSLVIEAGNPLLSEAEFAQLVDQLSQSAASSERIEYTLNTLMGISPALNSIGVLIMIILNGMIGQKILSKRQQVVRPNASFKPLQLPTHYMWVFIPALAASAFGVFGVVSVNVALVMAFPYFIVGLSLAHQMLHRYNLGTLGLVVLYAGMILFGWPILAVFIAGLFQPWLKTAKENVNELLDK